MVAHRMGTRYDVWELSAFLDHVGATPTARNDGVRVAYHSARGPRMKIGAVGLNYRDHAREVAMELPDRPLLFAKRPN